ncbi:MAG: hypothetical protein FJW37_09105, partial [Acidobacteria bacterium]|nr:hypothetical protein [Acidobacteriota bacterium]
MLGFRSFGRPVARWVVALALLWVLAPALGLAQTSTGSVNGVVSDSTGLPIAGAAVTLESIARGEKRTTVSSSAGYYEFLVVQPGPYRVSAAMQGFTTTVVDNVTVRVGAPYTAGIVLQVGQVTEKVTVEAAVQQVNATDAMLGNVIDQKEALVLPIRGRSFLEFATLSAGAISKYPGSWTSTFSGNRDSHAGISISGAKDVSTIYLLDGVSSKSPEYGQVGYLLPLDAVQEFNIQRGFFSAKYAGPAVINVASVAGSNGFHGVVWHTLRNDVFNARNFFDRASPAPLRQNQFGVRAGGRVLRDKLFWMGNFQVLRERRYQTLNGTAPTAREREGDFSASRTVLTGQPAGVVVVDPFTKQPFPGNVVPRARFDRFATTYLQYVPPALNQGLPFGQINRVLT